VVIVIIVLTELKKKQKSSCYSPLLLDTCSLPLLWTKILLFFCLFYSMYEKGVIIHLISYLTNANCNCVVSVDFYLMQFYFETVSNSGRALQL